jgi:redox-sensitive bicupin YhaK (pirin superfamily)
MLDIVIEARNAAISETVKVKRILPFRLRRMVGPFIFMDHAGPIGDIPANPSTLDVLPHPHIGLSTVSYVFAGQVTHRDSLGVEQVIHPGEVNWMTAGRGIAHSERFEDPSALAGGLEMIQTWVALPEKDEEAAPAFNNYKPEELPIFTENGVWMRLIAGDAYGLRNDVKVRSPLFYLHVTLQQGATFGLPKEHSERGFYIVKGSVEVSGNVYHAGQMLVFTEGADPVILAKKTLHSCFWEVNRWASVSSGGILSRVARSASNKRKKTGNRAGSYCRQMTIKNLFHCLMINRNQQEVHQSRNHFRDLQLYHVMR